MPPVTLSEQQFRAASSALTHVTHFRMAALTRTPLAGIKASSSTKFLIAWAVSGTWTCTRVWPTPDHARWPQANGGQWPTFAISVLLPCWHLLEWQAVSPLDDTEALARMRS